MERKTIVVEKCIKVNKEIFELNREELDIIYDIFKYYLFQFGNHEKDFLKLNEEICNVFESHE